MHCFCCYGAFFFFLVCVFNLTIHDSRLSSVSKRGLWIVKDPRRLPATQRAWFFFVVFFPSGLGPPALSRSALLAASAPAVKCDHSAPLGPGLGAVWEPNPWRAAFDGGGASTLWTRPCCLAVVGSHSCLRQLLARALAVNWTHLTSGGLCNG